VKKTDLDITKGSSIQWTKKRGQSLTRGKRATTGKGPEGHPGQGGGFIEIIRSFPHEERRGEHRWLPCGKEQISRKRSNAETSKERWFRR